MKANPRHRLVSNRLHSPLSPILCYVTDRTVLEERRFFHVVRRALAAGVNWIQLREKSTPTEELVRIAEKIVAMPRRPHQKLLVNDRLDIALVCGFDGIHLGGASFPVSEVRRRVPRGFLIGVSTHHLQEAIAAEQEGADYIIFGPLFPTPSKRMYGPPQGIEKLRAVTRAVSIPVLAIGGISRENFQVCSEAGAAGLAAISLFQNAGSVSRTVAELQ